MKSVVTSVNIPSISTVESMETFCLKSFLADDACFIEKCDSAIAGTTGIGKYLVYDYNKLQKIFKSILGITLNGEKDVLRDDLVDDILFWDYEKSNECTDGKFVILYPTVK